MSYETTTPAAERYTGKFFRQIFYNKENDYCIYLYICNKDVTTVVGTDLPKADYPVTFSGKWVNNKNHGLQFEADMVIEQVPSDPFDIISFISNLKIGIGKKMAQKMVSMVAAEGFWDTVQNRPETFRGVVPMQRISQLQTKVKKQLFMQRIANICGSDLKIDTGRYRQICSVFKDNLDVIPEMILENPFILVNAGFTFPELDQFACKRTKLESNDHRRLLGACLYVLLDGIKQCHSALPVELVLDNMNTLLNKLGHVDRDICKEFLKAADAQHEITVCNGLCYLNRSYEEESALVNILTKLNEIPPENLNPSLFESFLANYEEEKGFSLSPDQRKAVWMAMTRSVCVITGGPGTGKSTILDAIRACWKSFRPSERNALMAPTGRAAVRMTEVTGEYASTVHSALQLVVGNPSMRKMQEGSAYIHDELVIIDETSMLDQSTSASLVAALRGCVENTRQHLVLVGDPDQLPSVAYGNVLADIIASGVIPVCSLNTVYRQAQGNPIIENSIRIRNGDANLLWTPIFKGYHNGSEKANKEAVCRFYASCVKQYGIENVVLLSPYHQKTEISTNALNKILQDTINPDVGQAAILFGKKQYRLNDRVMMLKNTEELSNGDIGTVTEITDDSYEDGPGLTVLFESGLKYWFAKENLYQLELAYALTVHKSQGGQYRVVIMIMPDNTSPFLQRKVVYTGVTRSKEYFAVFGPPQVFAYAIRNNKYDARYTGLVARLRQAKENQLEAA